jgi:glycosyltransferase involved in cell wall biosynthesis
VVTPYFYPSIGGVEASLFNLYREIVKMDHNNVSIVTTFYGCPQKTVSNEVINGIEIYREQNWYNMASRIKKISPECDVIHLNGYVPLLMVVPAMVLSNKPIVMHCHGYDMICAAGGYLYSNGKNCSNISLKTCLSCSRIYFKQRVFLKWFLWKMLSKKVKFWIAVSHYVKRRLTSFYNIKDNIEVVYNSIPLNDFRFSKYDARCYLYSKRNIAKNDILIVTIGRISEEKGQELVIRSVPHLIQRGYRNFKIMIIGDGPLFSPLKELSRKLCIENHVIFTGKISEKEKKIFLKGSDFAIIPSIWHEPFGMVILDYMSAGLPIIGTNRGAIPELVKNGENGFIIRPEVKELVKKLELLIDDEKTRQKMGDQSLEMLKSYSSEVAAKKVISIFNRVIQQR